MFQPTAANITTLLLVAVTCWVIYARFKSRIDSNWPLFYYIAVVAYSKAFPGVMSPTMVFIGVVAGLFLRFEFMAGFVLNSIRVIELAVLGYVAWSCLSYVFF
jgi:hypothetical protein